MQPRDRASVPDIHLTYWLTSALPEEPPTAALEVLSPFETARCERLLVGRDRRDFAAAHALLRAALSATANRPHGEWRFEAGRFGKPHLEPVTASQTPIAFNLTHTRGLVACAVVKHAEVDVGIDVEAMERHADLSELARRFFATAEAVEILRLEGDNRERRFYETWTLKEAFIKALGEGLSHPLNSFCFRFDSCGSLRLEVSDMAVAARWQFALLDVIGRYRLSLAVRDRSPVARRVVVEEATSVNARVAPSALLLRASPSLIVTMAGRK